MKREKYIELHHDSSASGQFMRQNDAVASPEGKYVFVPDFENHRIQKFTSNNGTYILEWALALKAS
jgi:hypothetical protein